MDAILENSESLIFVKNSDLQFIYANQPTLNFFKKNEDEFIGSKDITETSKESDLLVLNQEESFMRKQPYICRMEPIFSISSKRPSRIKIIIILYLFHCKRCHGTKKF